MKGKTTRILNLTMTLIALLAGLHLIKCDWDLYRVRFEDRYEMISADNKHCEINLHTQPFQGHNFSITGIESIQITAKAVIGYCDFIAVPRKGMSELWFILRMDTLDEQFYYSPMDFVQAKRDLGIQANPIPVEEFLEQQH